MFRRFVSVHTMSTDSKLMGPGVRAAAEGSYPNGPNVKPETFVLSGRCDPGKARLSMCTV